MAYDFNSITEVRLDRGAHESPEQGMCFMEMVAWFAGEKHSDKPDCASNVLGTYGIGLNDRMPDDVRDRLLKPVVPMIAGTFDPANEQPRAKFLAMWSVNKVLPIILRLRGYEELAVRCEAAKDLVEARSAADAAYAAAYAANAAANAEQIWRCAVDGLRGAIQIGRCDGFGTADLPARHTALRELVKA